MSLDTERIVESIHHVMPENAEFQEVQGSGAINIRVAWKLNNDPARPHKMSKIILVCVTHEAAQDFKDASGVAQEVAYNHVSKFLATKLASFEPNHDTPQYERSPIEQWTISSKILLG
jgi:hypothetical protein